MEVYLHQSKKFQPTRPLRGATNSPTWDSRVAIVISTHAPLAGRDAPPLFRHNNIETISTHAPLAGRDVLVVSIGIKVFKFQPTRPLRGATESVPALATSDFLISTHAPLAGRDRGKGCTLLDSENFNPRAPCGARLQLKPQLFDFLDFNPRAPCGARQKFEGKSQNQ